MEHMATIRATRGSSPLGTRLLGDWAPAKCAILRMPKGLKQIALHKGMSGDKNERSQS